MKPTRQELVDVNVVNEVMDNVHNCANEIYEALVDREFEELKEVLDKMTLILKDIRISIEDETS